jgi:cytoskeletal protein CcmA (bactofilin family)
MPAKTEVDMFFKSKAPEKVKNAAANSTEVMERMVQQQHSVAEQVASPRGAVEGDIFHRSLSIDENSQFEGSSRRVENPIESSSSVDPTGPQKKDMQNPAPAPLPSIDADLQRVERWLAQSCAQMTPNQPFCTGEIKEIEMLNSMKSGAPEKNRNAAANAGEVIGTTVQPHDQAWAGTEPTTRARTASCIGSDMSIVGKIECNGPAQIFGRIEGELRASDLLISDGAQVEGNIIAQSVTICGHVKGTIRAVRVKLQNGGAVEGDIFHRSLSIDENSQFEGSSRRVENPTELSSRVDAKDPQKEDVALAPLASIDAELTVGQKH